MREPPSPAEQARVDALVTHVLRDDQQELICRPCEWVQGLAIIALVLLALVFRGWFRTVYAVSSVSVPLLAGGLILWERAAARLRRPR